MTQIKEDYCSFELSKLLKEKGFDEVSRSYFIANGGDIRYCGAPLKSKDMLSDQYLRPTLQLACKWLREVHKLHIAILWDCGAYIGKNSFCYHINRIDNYEDKGYNKIGFDTYEKACEAAIKYCLENLI